MRLSGSLAGSAGDRSKLLEAIRRRGLLLVLALALALRCSGLEWGLPGPRHADSYHPDEGTVYSHAATIATTGDLNPHFFNYGSLPLMIGALALRVTGAAPPAPSGLGYLVLRCVSVAAGVLTVLLAALAAGRLFRNGWAGLAAGLFCAAAPVHAVCSHYATVDVMAALFLAASFLGSVRLLDEDGWQWYVLAGAGAGLAAACKYVGIAAVLPAIAAHTIKRRSWKALVEDRALALPGFALVAFALGCPFAFLDSATFLRDLMFEVRHIREGGTIELSGRPPLWFFASQVLPCALSWPLLMGAIGGLALVVRRRRPAELMLASWCVLLCLLHGTGREIFVRYAVAVVPFLAVLFGALLLPATEGSQAAGIRWPARALAIAGGVTWLCGLSVACANVGLMTRADTRDEAVEFLVPAVGRSGQLGLANVPWFYTPPVLYLNTGPHSPRDRFFEEAAAKNVDLTITGWDTGVLDLKRPEWFVITEFEFRDPLLRGDPAATAFFAKLQSDYDLARVFEARLTVGVIELPRPRLHDWRYVSPEIRVYHRREGGGGT